MIYGKYDTISCKHYFHLLKCSELSCIDQENLLLIITNTMKIITILQPSNFNVFLHGIFYSVVSNKNICIKFRIFLSFVSYNRSVLILQINPS